MQDIDISYMPGRNNLPISTEKKIIHIPLTQYSTVGASSTEIKLIVYENRHKGMLFSIGGGRQNQSKANKQKTGNN